MAILGLCATLVYAAQTGGIPRAHPPDDPSGTGPGDAAVYNAAARVLV